MSAPTPPTRRPMAPRKRVRTSSTGGSSSSSTAAPTITLGGDEACPTKQVALWLSGRLTDTVVTVEGATFAAHRLVLAAACGYFERHYDHDHLRDADHPKLLEPAARLPRLSRARSRSGPCSGPRRRPRQASAKKLAPRRRFGPATVKALRRIACDRSCTCRCIRPKYAKIEDFWRFFCHSPATVRLQSGDSPATVRRQSGDSPATVQRQSSDSPATVRPSGDVGRPKSQTFSNSS